MRDVCVIGLGLLGGSVLRAAVTSGRKAWGATASAGDAEAASAEGFDASTDTAAALRRAEAEDALVVVAVPLTELDPVLGLVAEHASECLLTDVVSVKAPVREAVRRLAPRTRFAGGHPMAGTAESGWAASHAALFDGAAWVVTVDEDTDVDAWRESAALALALGAHVVPLRAHDHDEAVARVSHLPHLFAAVLASVGASGGPAAAALAAGSFRGGTRVAATRPELVRAMTEGNRTALLKVLDEALGVLGATRGSLASTGSLAATIETGHTAHRTVAEQHGAARVGVRVDLRAPDARAGLAGIGDLGGRVTSVAGGTAVGEVPEGPGPMAASEDDAGPGAQR